MSNDLREKLEALSAGACESEWGQYSPSYGPWKEQARQDRCAKWDTSHHVSRMGTDKKPIRVAELRHADTAAFVETLVNAFRSGDLVTRSEMEEAVTETYAMFCDAYDADVRGTELFQEELEAEVSKAVAKAVAKEREAMAGDTVKLLQQWFVKGVATEKMQDAPFVAARARSEQKEGE